VWLPSERTSPREARELVRAVCEDWGIDETISDDAFVVVTELVTNAVVRARTPASSGLRPRARVCGSTSRTTALARCRSLDEARSTWPVPVPSVCGW
jgi:hypothetical protein